MKSLLKDKRVVVLGAVVVLLLLIGGFVFSRGNNGQGPSATPTQVQVLTLSAEEIGLTLKEGRPGQTVVATIGKPEGITAAEYELSYTSKDDIPRGAIGEFDVSKKPVTKEITLGTCSDVCHYDTDVKNIKLIVKVTKEDGKVYQVETSLEASEEE